MHPAVAIVGLWVAWVVSWVAAAAWQRTTEKRVGSAAELRYRIVLGVGGVLLALPSHRYVGPLRLWRVTWAEAWVATGAIAVGFLFAWWARVHLGSLWSGSITKKTDHRVIESGPYRIVRHPIYTGILLAVIATGLVKGTVPSVVGAAVITVGLWMKAALEENWLREELGPEAYDGYRRRVPMLVPFGPTAG